MLYLHRLRLHFRSLFQKKDLDHQLDAELAFHLAEQKTEQCRDTRPPYTLAAALPAARVLRTDPALSLSRDESGCAQLPKGFLLPP